jgi:hypothetical protein
MAFEISSVFSQQIARVGRSTLSTLTGPSTTGVLASPSSTQLSDDLIQGRFATGAIRFDTRTARTAVAAAITAGNGVIAALHAIQDAVKLANHTSVVSADAGVLLSGTRVSRVNLEALVGRLLGRLDSLVDAAEINGANLIDSTSGTVTLQTTNFGGSVSISPQALDPKGLGIADLYLVTDSGVDGAITAIGKAIATAGIRLSNLETLQRALGFRGAADQSTARALSGALGGSLPTGSLVNLVA